MRNLKRGQLVTWDAGNQKYQCEVVKLEPHRTRGGHRRTYVRIRKLPSRRQHLVRPAAIQPAELYERYRADCEQAALERIQVTAAYDRLERELPRGLVFTTEQETRYPIRVSLAPRVPLLRIDATAEVAEWLSLALIERFGGTK